MLIVDAHLDLAWNAIGWNRDLTRSLAEVRQSEAGMPGKARGLNTVTLPEMRRAEVGICLATLLARVNPAARDPLLDFRAPEIAFAVAMGQLSYYKLQQERGWCKLIGNRRALQEQVAGWTSAPGQQPLGFIVSMEGADPILSPDQVPEWFDLGLRVIGLAHYGLGIYAHGTASSGGLTYAIKVPAACKHSVLMNDSLSNLYSDSYIPQGSCPGRILRSWPHSRRAQPTGSGEWRDIVWPP